MARVTHAASSKRRKKRIIKAAEGYWGKRSKIYRRAVETVRRAWAYGYRDRRTRKREFRSLWIMRLNAACRAEGLPYSRFISGLRRANVSLNRKVLADLAVHDAAAFRELVTLARSAAPAAAA